MKSEINGAEARRRHNYDSGRSMEDQNMKQQILMIDDDQSIGNLLEEVLTREGYETCAPIGKQKPSLSLLPKSQIW